MSSTFSAVQRVDGAPVLSGPICEPSPLASLMAGADSCSQPTTQDAECTPTSENSPPIDCDPISATSPMSSLALPLVRKSAPPTAKERALRTIISSGTGRASSSKSDLYGVRLRTALAQELKASTGYSMRWKRQTTPAGHAWWVLTMPAPITDENDFGSLLPTPSATSYGSNRGGAAGRTGDAGPSLASLIPTPTASCASQWPRHGERPSKEGQTLADILPKMLNTPRASRGYDSEEFSGGTAMNPRKLVYTMIPTPRASDATASGIRSGDRSQELATVAQLLLPTPTARDTRSDRASDQTMERNSRPLSETSGSLGPTGTVESPVSQRRALLLGLVLWMMGQAPSWLRACATAPSQRSVTPSSRKSQKPSGGQS